MDSIVRCTENDYPALVEVWERAVRPSHLFLSENDIAEIKAALVPEYFPAVELYAFVQNGVAMGFIGLAGAKIEMLFVDCSAQGRGIGAALMDFAIGRGAVEVDVNEQNPRALKFYLARGFRVVGRDARDDAGRPFPILHLSL